MFNIFDLIPMQRSNFQHFLKNLKFKKEKKKGQHFFGSPRWGFEPWILEQYMYSI